MAHVQGESLKVIAVVLRRLLNSPATSALLVVASPEGEFLAMDQPYSAWADWLNKFHTSSEWIQALWLVAGTVTVLGVTWLVMRGVCEMIWLSRRER